MLFFLGLELKLGSLCRGFSTSVARANLAETILSKESVMSSKMNPIAGFSRYLIPLMLTSLLVLALTSYSSVSVKAQEEPLHIYIAADGSVTPSSAPILRSGNLYTLTGNISNSDGIGVGRNNTIVDGAGYTIRPMTFAEEGVTLYGVTNVTIKNMGITKFRYGVTI